MTILIKCDLSLSKLISISQTFLGGAPNGELLESINKDFGSLDILQKQLSAAAVGVQGSGWAWLGYNKGTQRLQIAACANQDPLQATTGKAVL